MINNTDTLLLKKYVSFKIYFDWSRKTTHLQDSLFSSEMLHPEILERGREVRHSDADDAFNRAPHHYHSSTVLLNWASVNPAEMHVPRWIIPFVLVRLTWY